LGVSPELGQKGPRHVSRRIFVECWAAPRLVGADSGPLRRFKDWWRDARSRNRHTRQNLFALPLRRRHKTMTIRLPKTFPALVAHAAWPLACAVGLSLQATKAGCVKYHAADANLVTEQPFNNALVNQFADPVPRFAWWIGHWHRNNAFHRACHASVPTKSPPRR